MYFYFLCTFGKLHGFYFSKIMSKKSKVDKITLSAFYFPDK